jgi:hypothetical protein
MPQAEADAKEQPASVAPKKKKLSLSSLLPYIALTLSLFSLYLSVSTQREAARTDVIKTAYGFYGDMSRLQLQYPMMEHLLVVDPAVYASVIANARTATATGTDAERARWLLEERAVAHYVFTVYEETFFLRKQAEGGEPRRLQMLNENVEYFDSLVCNPRLLWYWDYWESGNGGRMGMEFSEELRDHYRDRAQKNCKTQKDGMGPFQPAEGRPQ